MAVLCESRVILCVWQRQGRQQGCGGAAALALGAVRQGAARIAVHVGSVLRNEIWLSAQVGCAWFGFLPPLHRSLGNGKLSQLRIEDLCFNGYLCALWIALGSALSTEQSVTLLESVLLHALSCRDALDSALSTQRAHVIYSLLHDTP